MSDAMLIGVLRMPVDDHGDIALMQLISRAQEAADRLEGDALKIDQLREALQDMMLDMDPERHDEARAALKATEPT